MTKSESLSDRINSALDTPGYQTEDLILSLTGEFLDRMDTLGISRAELAGRLGVQPPRVTRILQGNDNFTLRTLAGMANALDCKLVFTLAPRGAETGRTHFTPGLQTNIIATQSERRGLRAV